MAAPTVVIIGAGASGMCAAIQLRKQLGWKYNVTIYERSTGFSGTWYANSYPGCGCDVPSHIYSFSFALNPDWSKQYSMQPEILKYFEGVAKEYDLHAITKFKHEVQAMAWSDTKKVWQLKVKDLTSGEEHTKEATYIYNAVGPLCIPNFPDIPGLKNFKGKTMHTAQWDHSYDLTGKKVAMIGNAASGIQVIPNIVDQVDKLSVFQRTPNWITPRFQYNYPAILKWIFRNIPLAITIYRYLMYFWYDFQIVGFYKDTIINKLVELDCKWYIKRAIKDPELRKKVTPDYNVGCKRVLRSDDYLQALNKPNVSVITDKVVEIKGDKVVTTEGEFEADTLIFATGFQVSSYLENLDIKGENGVSLHHGYWKNVGDIKTYWGTTVPNFPNFFTMLGPNTGTGHISVIMIAEAQVDYTISLIKEAQRQGLTHFSPTQKAYEEYNAAIQQKLQKFVWTASCKSWYKTDSGVTALWPGSIFAWYWQLGDVDWSAYNMHNAKNLPQSLTQKYVSSTLASLAVLVSVGAVAAHHLKLL